MAEWLKRSPLALKVRSSQTACARKLSKTLVYPAGHGYPALSASRLSPEVGKVN